MIHVDTKQLARFERVGHRITGDRRLGSSRGAGYENAHVAIDDTTRLSYVEVLPDEKPATTVGFLLRAVAWFEDHGITCKRVLSSNVNTFTDGSRSLSSVAFTLLGSIRTPAAAIKLGCSQNHLKRYRDTHGGFLIGGEHYILGASHSATILWNVPEILMAFHYRGMLR